MFKVLFISYYFPPMGLSGVQRSLKFAKYLKQFNWEPTILTAGDTAYYAHDYELLKEAENAELKIVRTEGSGPNQVGKKKTVKIPREIIRKTLSNLSKFFFIPDNKIGWSNSAYKKGKELLSNEKFDIIYVTCPPFSSFVTAAKLKKEFDLPLIVDYRDLWFGNQFSFMPTPYHKMQHKKLEYESLKAADKVIVINRRIKERLIKQYQFLTFDDVVIYPHGFDPEDFEKSVPIPKPHNKLILTYSGIFYENITPKYLIKAFKKLSQERPDIAANYELHFVGYFRKENQQLVNRLGLQEFVKDHGYLNHKDAIQRIISSDVLWMMVGETQSAETISTSKLFEYFGSRKPVLGCVPDGAAKTALEEYGASFIVPPDDIDAIMNSLIRINELYKKGNLPTANEEYVNRHNRIKLTEQLAKQFQFYLKAE